MFDVYESKKATVFRVMAAVLFISPVLNQFVGVLFDKPSLTTIVWLLADVLCLIGLFLVNKKIIIVGNVLVSVNYLLLFFSEYDYGLLIYLIPYIMTVIALLTSSSKEQVIKNGIKPLSYGICIINFAAIVIVSVVLYGSKIENVVLEVFRHTNTILTLVFTNLWNAEMSMED